MSHASSTNESLVVSGGFGDVRFEVRQGMRVAVKTPNKEGYTLRHEANILAPLRHPYIPLLLHASENEIVMADLGRQTLVHALQADVMSRVEYDNVAWCIASALAYLHRIRVYHSDVKCDNILVQSTGEAVLIDYGLAQRSETGHTSFCCGSRAYVAPETTRGHGTWDAFLADVWSFSVVYYAILFHHLPFDSAHKIYGRYANLHSCCGSVESLRQIWNSDSTKRDDVKKIHEMALDSIMQPVPAHRPGMDVIERSLYCIKHGLEEEEEEEEVRETSS